MFGICRNIANEYVSLIYSPVSAVCESHTSLLVSLAMREGLVCLIGPELSDPLTFLIIPQYQ
jgi:hypothetical protein